VPAVLKERCADPVAVPVRDLGSAEAARLWGADRAALGECRRRHSALADSVAAIEAQGR